MSTTSTRSRAWNGKKSTVIAYCLGSRTMLSAIRLVCCIKRPSTKKAANDCLMSPAEGRSHDNEAAFLHRLSNNGICLLINPSTHNSHGVI